MADTTSEDKSSPVPIPKGSYTFNFDDYDESYNPFQSKGKLGQSPPGKGVEQDPFKSQTKLSNSPPPPDETKVDPFQSKKKIDRTPRSTPTIENNNDVKQADDMLLNAENSDVKQAGNMLMDVENSGVKQADDILPSVENSDVKQAGNMLLNAENNGIKQADDMLLNVENKDKKQVDDMLLNAENKDKKQADDMLLNVENNDLKQADDMLLSVEKNNDANLSAGSLEDEWCDAEEGSLQQEHSTEQISKSASIDPLSTSGEFVTACDDSENLLGQPSGEAINEDLPVDDSLDGDTPKNIVGASQDGENTSHDVADSSQDIADITQVAVADKAVDEVDLSSSGADQSSTLATTEHFTCGAVVHGEVPHSVLHCSSLIYPIF